MIRYGEHENIDPQRRVEAWLLLIEQEILRRGLTEWQIGRPPSIRIESTSPVPADIVDLLDDSLKEHRFRLRREVRFDGVIEAPVWRSVQNRDHSAAHANWVFIVEGDEPCVKHWFKAHHHPNGTAFCEHCGVKAQESDYVYRPSW